MEHRVIAGERGKYDISAELHRKCVNGSRHELKLPGEFSAVSFISIRVHRWRLRQAGIFYKRQPHMRFRRFRLDAILARTVKAEFPVSCILDFLCVTDFRRSTFFTRHFLRVTISTISKCHVRRNIRVYVSLLAWYLETLTCRKRLAERVKLQMSKYKFKLSREKNWISHFIDKN